MQTAMRTQVHLKFSFLCLLFASSLQAAPNPYDIPNSIDDELQTIFRDAFNLHFDEARTRLKDIKKHAAAHPVVALAGVVVEWWDLSVKVLESDAQASEAFLNAGEECMEFAERTISSGDKKGEGHLALGTTLGLMSRWSAANRAWVPAYMRGSRSARYSERALKKNPKALDAYMALGTFNYAREILRERLSVNDTKSTTVSVRQGIRQLEKASNDGFYFQSASRLLLAGLLTNERPNDALPVLQQLRTDMPTNGFVHMVLITALYNASRTEELARETTSYVENVSTGTYSPWFQPQAHFALGLLSFRDKQWKEAAQHFGDAVDVGEESNPYFTWAHLYQGYAYDALGERRKAKKMYEKVLKLRRRFASHDHARDHLDSPFRDTDLELKKLEL